MHISPTHLLLTAALSLLPWAAAAQSVALSGVSGSRALIVVDGGAPRFLSAGQSHQGVKLLSVGQGQAVIELNGKTQTLILGEAAVSIGSSGAGESGQRIVLTADSRGHFMPQGQINGRTVQFMVDTGATGVGISEAQARRINLRFDNGKPVRLNTANGVVIGHLVKLVSVRIGDVVVYDVDATVTPQPMPYVLLGNSYLTRFQMQRINDQLTLEKRY